MKRIMYIVYFIFICNILLGQNNKQISNNPLIKVQERINFAFESDLKLKSCKNLEAIENSLNRYNNKHLIVYWKSYVTLFKTMFYLQNEENEKAKATINEGIKKLKELPNKNSDDYALLAFMQCISLPTISMGGMYILGDISKNIKKAIKLDPKNIRAHYVAGAFDFYTPKELGGEKEAEGHFLKAISLPESNSEYKYMPTWGKEESYILLIQLYKDKSKIKLAKKYYDIAKEKYPTNIQLKNYESIKKDIP